MALPGLIRLNYKLIEKLTYLKINNTPLGGEMTSQTDTNAGLGESLRKKFGEAWLRTAQEG